MSRIPIALSVLFALVGGARAAVIFYEELEYFQSEDSPFHARIAAGNGYLEDFEDHALDTPHVVSWDVPRLGSIQIGRTHRFATGTGVPVNQNSTWSVDADDGLNGDFRGDDGDSWTTVNASQGGILGFMEFRFEPDPLGRYPTFVGFVITEALDPFSDVEFGTATLSGPEAPDNSYDPLSWIPPVGTVRGDARTHRFFGIEVEDGITRLTIDNVRQIDHLQYGYAPVPEPTVAVSVMSGIATLSMRRRRRSS